MQIVPLTSDRIPDAAALLRGAALEFILPDCTPEFAAGFLEQHGEAGLRGFVAAGYVYHAALLDGELAGFIGVRDRSHVFHLFVDARRQRRGIARRLWEHGRDAALGPGYPGPHSGLFTVNASNHAVPFYAALGFERSAPPQAGPLPYNPMAYRVPDLALYWAQ